MLTWLEGTALATTVRESLMLTAVLSAVHALGVTLVGGGAVLMGLRVTGGAFADRPPADVLRPAGWAVLLGVSICLATGVALVSPRAAAAVDNGFFQLKMLMLAGAAISQLAVARGAWQAGWPASILWLGVLLAGSAFILLE
jgi:hypothetical protein